VIDPELTPAQRGRRVRELVAMPRNGPFGQSVTVSNQSIRRWMRAYREGGFDALFGDPSGDRGRVGVEDPKIMSVWWIDSTGCPYGAVASG
jgi:transposase